MADVEELVAIWNRYNVRMRRLVSGESSPSSEKEHEFLKFVRGEKSVETIFEQAWH